MDETVQQDVRVKLGEDERSPEDNLPYPDFPGEVWRMQHTIVSVRRDGLTGTPSGEGEQLSSPTTGPPERHANNVYRRRR